MALAGASQERSKSFGRRVDGSSVNNGIRTESTSIVGNMYRDNELDRNQPDQPEECGNGPFEPGSIGDLLLGQNVSLADLSHAINSLFEKLKSVLAAAEPEAKGYVGRDTVNEGASDVCKRIANHTDKIRDMIEAIHDLASRAKI